MKLIDNIKRNTGLSALNKALKTVKRNKFIHNLVTARSVAIIGVVNTIKDFDDIAALQKFLVDKNMLVDIIVYYPGKETPQQFLFRKNINLFNKNEVNWYGKPLHPSVELFCRKEYDILIDLTLEETFPMRWIATLSRSRFKVGSLSYTGNPYELIITVDSRKEIAYLSEQIIHYLNLINNRFAQEQDDFTNP